MSVKKEDSAYAKNFITKMPEDIKHDEEIIDVIWQRMGIRIDLVRAIGVSTNGYIKLFRYDMPGVHLIRSCYFSKRALEKICSYSTDPDHFMNITRAAVKTESQGSGPNVRLLDFYRENSGSIIKEVNDILKVYENVTLNWSEYKSSTDHDPGEKDNRVLSFELRYADMSCDYSHTIKVSEELIAKKIRKKHQLIAKKKHHDFQLQCWTVDDIAKVLANQCVINATNFNRKAASNCKQTIKALIELEYRSKLSESLASPHITRVYHGGSGIELHTKIGATIVIDPKISFDDAAEALVKRCETGTNRVFHQYADPRDVLTRQEITETIRPMLFEDRYYACKIELSPHVNDLPDITLTKYTKLISRYDSRWLVGKTKDTHSTCYSYDPIRHTLRIKCGNIRRECTFARNGRLKPGQVEIKGRELAIYEEGDKKRFRDCYAHALKTADAFGLSITIDKKSESCPGALFSTTVLDISPQNDKEHVVKMTFMTQGYKNRTSEWKKELNDFLKKAKEKIDDLKHKEIQELLRKNHAHASSMLCSDILEFIKKNEAYITKPAVAQYMRGLRVTLHTKINDTDANGAYNLISAKEIEDLIYDMISSGLLYECLRRGEYGRFYTLKLTANGRLLTENRLECTWQEARKAVENGEKVTDLQAEAYFKRYKNRKRSARSYMKMLQLVKTKGFCCRYQEEYTGYFADMPKEVEEMIRIYRSTADDGFVKKVYENILKNG